MDDNKKSQEEELTRLQGYAIYSSLADDKEADQNKKNENEKEADFAQNPIEIFDDTKTGYQGYLYEEKGTGRLIIVHRGSQAPFTKHPNDKYYPISEFVKDWFMNDFTIIRNKIPAQFYRALDFARWVKKKYPNREIIQVGQSLGGGLAQMVGALAEFRDMETITFNAIGTWKLGKKLFEEGYKLSGDYSNISNYTYKNEKVSRLDEHFGKVYVADYKDKNFTQRWHNIKAHQDNPLEYEEVKFWSYVDDITGVQDKWFETWYLIFEAERRMFETIDSVFRIPFGFPYRKIKPYIGPNRPAVKRVDGPDMGMTPAPDMAPRGGNSASATTNDRAYAASGAPTGKIWKKGHITIQELPGTPTNPGYTITNTKTFNETMNFNNVQEFAEYLKKLVAESNAENAQALREYYSGRA